MFLDCYRLYRVAAVLFTILIIANACTCPTELDTPRIIEPHNSAKVKFVNLHSTSSINIYSDDISVISDFNNGTDSDYYAVVAGSELMAFTTSSDSTLLNIPYYCEKDGNYTGIFCNRGSFCDFKLIDDAVAFENGKYLRLINATPDLYTLKIESIDFEQELKFLESTDFFKAEVDNCTISIYSNGHLAIQETINISDNSKTTYILHEDNDMHIKLFTIQYNN